MRRSSRLLVPGSIFILSGCGTATDPPDGGGGTGGAGAAVSGGGQGGAALVCSALDFDALASDVPVSFTADVLPIFQTACVASPCHCSRDFSDSCGPQSKADLFLGVAGSAPVDAAVADAVWQDLVGRASTTAPEALRVVAGDPASSFLVQKLTGTQNDQGYACTVQDPTGPPPCGAPMPNVGGFLCESTPERFVTVVRWILQGALEN